jgi:hypothetical protein
MRVKIQIDSDSGFACVRRQSDHAQVGEPEEQVTGRFSEFSEDEE